MNRQLFISLAFLTAALLPGTATAFCGFYVAKADSKLFNKTSQVVLARDGNRTVATMASDFSGDSKEFAVVVPVPTMLQREQIHVTEQAIVEHLDAYSSPRLVEYFDENPCQMMYRMEAPMAEMASGNMKSDADLKKRARSLGVTIEASYTVGEYDILLLSATQSDGLVAWLRQSGYRIPTDAEKVVRSYLKQGMRFFVAKVNLAEQQRLGFAKLRPLQIAYEHPKFMLPIRLGMVNADGAQELYVYALTRNGRVETTNYRTVKMPTGMKLPEYVKEEFGDFYQAMFTRQTEAEGSRAVFVEHAWDMAWCDPCAADPLSQTELRQLGVFWLNKEAQRSPAQNVFLTRLHVRYDREHFPEDLVFHETGDRSNFQGRYVIQHAWAGSERCPQAEHYFQVKLPRRNVDEARTLARLTGWPLSAIRGRMPVATLPASEPWWKTLWD